MSDIKYEEEDNLRPPIVTGSVSSLSATTLPRAMRAVDHDREYEEYLNYMTIKNPIFKKLKSTLTEAQRIEIANRYLP